MVDAVYGSGTGAIWLDDVKCTGRETSLLHCTKSNWGTHDCSHAEDAGVICTDTAPLTPDGNTYIYSYIVIINMS